MIEQATFIGQTVDEHFISPIVQHHSRLTLQQRPGYEACIFFSARSRRCCGAKVIDRTTGGDIMLSSFVFFSQTLAVENMVVGLQE